MGGEEVPKRQEGGTLRGREGNLEVRGGAGQGAGPTAGLAPGN